MNKKELYVSGGAIVVLVATLIFGGGPMAFLSYCFGVYVGKILIKE